MIGTMFALVSSDIFSQSCVGLDGLLQRDASETRRRFGLHDPKKLVNPGIVNVERKKASLVVSQPSPREGVLPQQIGCELVGNYLLTWLQAKLAITIHAECRIRLYT